MPENLRGMCYRSLLIVRVFDVGWSFGASKVFLASNQGLLQSLQGCWMILAQPLTAATLIQNSMTSLEAVTVSGLLKH